MVTLIRGRHGQNAVQLRHSAGGYRLEYTLAGGIGRDLWAVFADKGEAIEAWGQAVKMLADSLHDRRVANGNNVAGLYYGKNKVVGSRVDATRRAPGAPPRLFYGQDDKRDAHDHVRAMAGRQW